MAKRGRVSRKLRFEAMEARAMLAGNVLASVSGGSLFIRGDALDNRIAVTAGQAPGEFVVSGIGSPGDTTKVNGADAPYTAQGVVNDLVIDLRGGKNVLNVMPEFPPPQPSGAAAAALTLPRNLFCLSGGQSDAMFFVNLDVQGSCFVNTGAGDDYVLISQSSVGGNVSVDVQAGANTLGVVDLTVDGGLCFLGGSGSDTVHFGGLQTGRGACVSTGLGHDEVGFSDTTIGGPLSVSTGAGNDTVTVLPGLQDLGLAAAGVCMDLGIGNDQLTLQGLQTTGMVLAMLGAGNDVLKVSRCELGTAFFVGGLGYDRFERDDPSYRSLWFERIVDLPLQAAIVQAFSLTMSSGAGYAFGRLVLRTTDGYTTWQFSPYSGPTPTGMHIHRWGQSPDVPLLDLGVPVVKFGKITGSAVVNQGTATEIVNALGQGFYMDIHYQGGSMASNLAPVS